MVGEEVDGTEEEVEEGVDADEGDADVEAGCHTRESPPHQNNYTEQTHTNTRIVNESARHKIMRVERDRIGECSCAMASASV